MGGVALPRQPSLPNGRQRAAASACRSVHREKLHREFDGAALWPVDCSIDTENLSTLRVYFTRFREMKRFASIGIVVCALAAIAAPAAATPLSFEFNVDHCTGTCGGGPYGTIDLS